MGTARTSLDEAVFERRLINMNCLHGFLPDEFGISIIIPVVKDRLGDICSANNYTPLTVRLVLLFRKYFSTVGCINMNIFFTPISCSSVIREIWNIRMHYLFFITGCGLFQFPWYYSTRDFVKYIKGFWSCKPHLAVS